MIRILTIALVLSCFTAHAQQWDQWFDGYVWSYEKVYPGEYSESEVLSYSKELSKDALSRALAATTPPKVLIVKRFDHFPEELFQLTSIEVLDISWCNFSMSELSRIGEFQNLKALNIYHTAKSHLVGKYTVCECKDELPEGFGDLANLEYLRLYDNGILKPIPESFGKLTNLKQLEIASQPTLILPNSIGNLENLKIASFYHFEPKLVQGMNPAFFELRQLRSLNLGMVWTDADELSSYAWQNFSVLEELELDYYNALSRKKLPQSVYNLPNLKKLFYPSGIPLLKADRTAYKAANKKLRIIKIR